MRIDSFPSLMLRLSTIGPVSIQVGDSRVPTANHQAFSALLYLIVERGKPVPRRTLVEMFFPGSSEDAGNHSLRQLVYRLRKIGANIESNTSGVCLGAAEATWDAEELLARGVATEEELERLAGGYLRDYGPLHSERFEQWLEEHRALMISKLRHLLITQMNAARAQRRYRALDGIARACLALDPLNEEATLAAAESLAMSGAKAEAISLLDRYLEEIGSRSNDLRVPPRMLRERISDYVSDPDRTELLPLIGRERELTAMAALLEEAATGAARTAIVTGPSGIGKTRLLNEVCSMAALSGFAVIHARLNAHDARRPFAILRELGPALLDLPGAIGASPEALATVRGLCGRGPSPRRSVPDGTLEAQALVAEVHAHVLELIDAVAGEQPLLAFIEDAHWMDEASVEMLPGFLSDRRELCVLIASQRPLQIPPNMAFTMGVSHFSLTPLSVGQSAALLEGLFRQAKCRPHAPFIESATRTAGGIPFYLHVLFRHFQETGKPEAIPDSLSDSLAARLQQLTEPARSVFDTIVVLGSASSTPRIEQLTQLPRHDLLRSLRALEEAGFIRLVHDSVVSAHDLFTTAVVKQMPLSVARLLHRSAATLLENESGEKVEPLAVAAHWEACGEDDSAVRVLKNSANACLSLGRPQEAVASLMRAEQLTQSGAGQTDIQIQLFRALRAAADYPRALAVSNALDLTSGKAGLELHVLAISTEWAAGRSIQHHRTTLEAVAPDRSQSQAIRALAAKALVIIAEELRDKCLGQRVVNWVADLDQTKCQALVPRLMYETVFGSRVVATAIATKVCRAALASTTFLESQQAHADAVLATWRNGEGVTAMALCVEAYNVSLSQKNWAACVAYSSMICEILWTVDEIAEAKRWFDTSATHFTRTAYPDRGLHHLSLGIRLALHAEDAETAEAFLVTAEKRYAGVFVDRMKLERDAYSIRIKLARGGRPTEAETEELLQGHTLRRHTGNHDIIADTVIAALTALGRQAEAALVRSEYLSVHRADAFPVPKTLKCLAGVSL